MKKFLFLFITFFALTFSVFAKEFEIPKQPNPARLVNILSKSPFLSADEINALESKLVTFSDSTSNQIAIVVVDDLNGLTANEFATEIGYQWGIGQKKLDNGIVILLSLGGGTGNRDYFIAVGYGLEGAIPDLAVKRIQESELIPYLKTGNYFQALNKTTDVLMALAKGEINSSEYAKNKPGENSPAAFIIFLLIIGLIIFSIIKNNKNGGGNGGRRSLMSDLAGPILMGMMNSGGRSSSGGFGGGGGGFGGFGGGSFGGGGAGGKW